MKKVLFAFLVLGLLWSCDSKKSEEAVRQQWVDQQMAREYKEAELDSLALVATGQEGDASSESSRLRALSVLRSELPNKKEVWDKVEKTIFDGSVYGDDEDEVGVFDE